MRSVPAQLLLAAALLAACGNTKPTINIAVNPSTARIPASVTVTVTGTSGGLTYQDGMTPAPIVTTDLGSFTDTSMGMDATMTADSNTITGHAVTLTLYAPATPGTAHLKATYTDPYGTQVNATTTVTFTTGTDVQSLTFSCAARNIGAFAYTGDDLATICYATAFDNNHDAVMGANIQYLAEAGAMMNDPQTGVLEYVPHVTSPGSNEAPKDVAPLGDPMTGEPRWVDTSTPGNPTRNPRDGLCTIVAWILGSAPGGLQGEPYVDADDSGAYELGEDFVDLNGNGVWDSTQTTAIWVPIKILWTGAIGTMAPAITVAEQGSTSWNIALGADLTVNFTLLDQNLNVLAAASSADLVSWTLSAATNSADLATNPYEPTVTTNLAVNKFGIDMDDQYNIIMPDQLATYEVGAQYPLQLTNATTTANIADLASPGESWSVNGTLTRTLFLDQTGTAAGQMDGEMTATAAGLLVQ